MAPTYNLSAEVIAQIVGLWSANHTIKEICDLTGAGATGVKYLRLFREKGSNNIPKIKPRPGRPRKTSKRASAILK